MSLHVKADIIENRLYLKLSGNITDEELDRLYTDIRFIIADLSPGFGVISDADDYLFSNIQRRPYKKVSNYLLTNGLGEVVQVIRGDSLLYEQSKNISLQEFGMRPIFAKTIKEAEEKLTSGGKRNGIRFYTNNIDIKYSIQNQVGTGKMSDISTGGCSVKSFTMPVRVNDEMNFEILTNSHDYPFEATARIIRVTDESFSAKFNKLDKCQKMNLWKFLISHHNT